MKRTIGFFCLVGCVGSAFATGTPSYGAFNAGASISGLSTTISGGGLIYNMVMGAAPTLVYHGDTYTIQNIYGVYALSGSGALSGAGPDYTGWSFDFKDAGGTGVAGWTGPSANDGLYAGGSQLFQFTNLDVANVTDLGYHIRIVGTWTANSGLDTTGSTAYFRFGSAPEPASLAGLALGLGVLVRRRRRKV